MRFSSVKALACVLLLAGAGCRYIDVNKGVDGSWQAKYYSYGLWTTLGSLEVSVTTNGVAYLKMNDLGTDVSTNHITIIDSSGKVVADITGNLANLITK